MPRPTICYLTKRFPRLSETFILDEILGLEANGVPLRLFAVADPGEPQVQPDVDRVVSTVTYLRTGLRLRDRIRDHRRFLAGHAWLARRDPRRWVGAVYRLARARRKWIALRHFLEAGGLARDMDRAGGVHLHAAFAHGPASIAYYLHLLTGWPYSFAAHAKDLYLSSPEGLAAKIRAASFVTACSASAAAELERIVAPDGATPTASGGTVVLAPHGVDISRFAPRSGHGPQGGGGGPLRILAVGRLVAKKGYPVLLGALADLAQSGVDARCRIIGGGGLRSELEPLCRTLGLDDRVTFCGSRTQQEIIAEYHWADVFVQASVVTSDGDRDGIPNSLLEAMASATAVVATTVAGIPEVVEDGVTGLLVPPGRAAPLASALRSLAEDPDGRVRLGAAARRSVEEHHDRRACVRLPAGLFLDVLARPPACTAAADPVPA